MDGKKWSIIYLLVLALVFIEAWKSSREDRRDLKDTLDRNDDGRRLHYHSKRHMQLENEVAMKRSSTSKIGRQRRKKPSGHLTPLEEDDLDNDEVVSVAIHPPPARPKLEKVQWKHTPKPASSNILLSPNLSNLIKNVFIELGQELITKHVSNDFIFGQYVGSVMEKLTSDSKQKLQHEILNLLLKYQQKKRPEETNVVDEKHAVTSANPLIVTIKGIDKKLLQLNETDDTWPDFTNIEAIVR